jgi:urease accessory protein
VTGPDLDDLPHALALRRAGDWRGPVHGRVLLAHAERTLHRRRLETEAGEGFFLACDVDAPARPGDAFALADGRLIAVAAAAEPLLAVRGPDLALYAWIAGNRHAPCAFAADRLLVRPDAALAAALTAAGAVLEALEAPFLPASPPPGCALAAPAAARTVIARGPVAAGSAGDALPPGGPFAAD